MDVPEGFENVPVYTAVLETDITLTDVEKRQLEQASIDQDYSLSAQMQKYMRQKCQDIALELKNDRAYVATVEMVVKYWCCRGFLHLHEMCALLGPDKVTSIVLLWEKKTFPHDVFQPKRGRMSCQLSPNSSTE